MISAEARPLGLPLAREKQRLLGRARLGRPALAAALATGLVLGNLALRANMIGRGYALSRLEQTLAAAQVEYDRLNLAATHLCSLERVEEVARLELGMTDPSASGFMVLAPVDFQSPSPAAHALAAAPRGPSGLGNRFVARAGDALLGLVSPFVARWFYDIPDSDHPRIRLR